MSARYLGYLTALVFVLAPNGLAKDDNAAEYKKAEGSWSITLQESDGEAVPEAFLKPFRAVMKGDTFTLYNGEKELVAGSYKIVEVKGKRLKYDFTYSSGPDKGVTMSLLAEWIDDDTYRTCVRVSGKERPTEFTSKQGSGQTVAIYKRAKK